jgi:non-canonical (house-cleaning) NTP pyrophosphatase
MVVYLTSTNKDKLAASQQILHTFNPVNGIIECVLSESGIEGGQPYGLDETKQACINRTHQFISNEDFISIENGFVRQSDELWYDIAFVYVRIEGKYYSGWSEKRWFPKTLYNDTSALINYFETNSISRFKQLHNCVLKLR